MKMQKSMITLSQRFFGIALGITLFACGGQQQGQQAGAPEYAVMTIETSVSKLNNAYPATIKGRQDVEIRPNVSGFITKLCVDEGAVVKKGQTLFVIDPVQYEEAVNVARAAVNVAKANVATAELTAKNKEKLAEKNIISLYELQMANNTLASQKAALAQTEAQLINAEKNLSYTNVTSPSNGVVGKIPFRVGSLVSPSSVTALTTVSDNSEMYVYFSMNEKDILKLTRESNGATQGALNQMPAVELQLVDGSIYNEKGKIETLSGVIDQTTGAASVRATFPNPNGILRSGGSGVILLPEEDDKAIIIPQKATMEIQDKKFVFVVNDSSIVKMTEIKILPVNDGKTYVVTSGLNTGDRIVVEGVGTTVRDGMTVKPITVAEATAKRQQVIAQQSSKH
ncbi:efflux RND transporter periplasmic adaptor subunit [uncultured Butyricimonas sp.]|uniref:efflux RND transporter periplasmic adaptor subunit n=1 Tax=uncultured Butyricimonas sp. TaxID=1268785 RepID=UPI0026DB8353|nr:efflux RND transporter periplasmic adaptor subunit [uncultured Butyricimonas sp.]